MARFPRGVALSAAAFAVVAAFVPRGGVRASPAVSSIGSPADEQPFPPDSIRAWLASGRIALADSAARANLGLAERLYGSESREAADARDQLVETLRLSGKGAQAGVKELAISALTTRRRLSGDESTPTLSARKNLAIILAQLGERAAARDSLRTVLELQRRLIGSDSLPTADTEQRLALVLNDLGDEEQALSLMEHALRSLERILPEDDSRLGDARNDQANILTDLGEYEAARLAYLEALRVYENAYGRDAPQVAVTLANMARLQYRVGDFTGSRVSFQRAAATQEAIARRDSTFTGNLRRLGFTLTYFGETLEALGDYAAARDTLERACRIRERALGVNHVVLATTLIQLADVYKDLRLLERARDTYDRASNILLAKSGPDDPNYAVALQSRADVLSRLGRGAEAESLSAKSLRILTSAYGPSHHLTARGMAMDADIRFRLDHRAEAASELEQALQIESSLLGPDSPELAAVQALLARVRWSLGDSTGALELALQAERVAREHLRVTGRLLSEREALGYASTRAAGLGIALSIAGGGIPDSSLSRVYDTVIRSRAVVLDEMATRHQVVREGMDTVAVRLSQSLGIAATRYSNLAVRGSEASHPEQFAKALEEARREKEAAERDLAVVSGSLRRHRDELRRGWKEVAASIPAGSSLISFVRFGRVGGGAAPSVGDREDGEEAAYAAFIAGVAGRLTWVDLGPAEPIDKAIAAWRREAAYGLFASGRTSAAAEQAYRGAGTRLRRLLWDPIEKSLGSARRIFLVPDGAISYVTFDAMPLRAGRYLIDGERVFHYLSAERDLAAPPATDKNTGLVAFGGLDFDHIAAPSGRDALPPPSRLVYRGFTPSTKTFRDVRFASLPATSREVKEIAHLWLRARAGAGSAFIETESSSRPVVLEGVKGDEATFKRVAQDAGVLHVASHGFFLDGGSSIAVTQAVRGIGGIVAKPSLDHKGTHSSSPASSSQEMPKQAPDLSSSVPYENPLLLAGLALAGANRRQSAAPGQEDGVLTAEEIAAMDLSGVRWAVLSACDTGAGRATSGEGLLGLRRAFRTAGVGTLIMSLWQADDEGTRSWMRTLYLAHRAKGRGAADAAREASLASLQLRRKNGRSTHPFFWAGFVAAGDWR